MSSRPPPPFPPRPKSARDLLGEVSARALFRRADLGDVLMLSLEKQVLADQYARLEQAGHSSAGKFPLARWFVDTPAPSQARLRNEPTDEDDRLKGFIEEMVRLEPHPFAQ